MRQGGMNKRQAGEDFYFLHKIIPLGHFGEINTTRVIPSPRPSDRVPFGTGRAVRDYLATHKFETYPLEAFRDLKQFFSIKPSVDTLRDFRRRPRRNSLHRSNNSSSSKTSSPPSPKSANTPPPPKHSAPVSFAGSTASSP